MNLLINKDNLLNALVKCKWVSEKKSTLPAVSCLLIQASGNIATVTATDLYNAIRVTLEAEVIEGGGTVVNTDELFTRLKMMPSDKVKLLADKKNLEVLDGTKLRYKVPCLDVDTYPALPEPEERAATIEFDGAQLLKMLDQTMHAMSRDSTRTKLCCSLFEIGKEESSSKGMTRVRVVASDGHRLAISETLIPRVDNKKSMLLPYKACIVLAKLLKGVEHIELVDSTSGFFVNLGDGSAGSACFSTRLIDEAPVNYDGTIPTASKVSKKCWVERKRLLEAIKAVALSTNEYTGGITLTFDKNILTVVGDDPNKGTATDEVAVEYEDDVLIAGYNARYLTDVLEAFDDEVALLQMYEALDPLIVRPQDTEELSFFGLVMPIRV